MIPRDEADEDGIDSRRDTAGQASPVRPGSSTFTIEGRQAPALFVVGWLATLLGLGGVAIALLAGGGGPAPILLIGSLLVLSLGLVAGAGSQSIERRARAHPPGAYAGPSPFLVFAASIPLTLLAAVAVGVPLSFAGLDVEGPVGRLAAVLAGAVVYLLLIRVLVVDTGALDWSSMGVSRFDGRALVELGRGALWAAPIIVLTSVVAGVLAALLPVQPVSPLPPAGETTGFILNLIAGMLVAPVVEELFFRGYATTAWARNIGPQRAILRGALFFAVVHVLTISGDTAPEAISLAIVGFVSRIPVAIALGWLFLRRRSIWASIGLHAAFNGVLLVLAEAAARSGLL